MGGPFLPVTPVTPATSAFTRLGVPAAAGVRRTPPARPRALPGIGGPRRGQDTPGGAPAPAPEAPEPARFGLPPAAYGPFRAASAGGEPEAAPPAGRPRAVAPPGALRAADDEAERPARLATRRAPQGPRALDEARPLPVPARVQLLARALLADDPAAARLAGGLGAPLGPWYAVTVVRLNRGPLPGGAERRDRVLTALARGGGTPVTWHDPAEFVALLPCDAGALTARGPGVRERALALVHAFATLVGRPCAAGISAGRTFALAEAFHLARRISRVAPLEAVPSRLHTLPDVFVELCCAGQPDVDAWLRDVARRLSRGPDLLATLDAYYRNDMNRLRTATELGIHPRTLDYRLRRARDLSGTDPGSAQGVRVLGAAVTRVLAGAWEPEPPTAR
ncbi:hypothetical protein GCM10027168_65440 [Streptomyces capparidis]